MLDKTWIPGLPPQQQPFYQKVMDFKYWTVLGCFNNYNIIKLSHKAMTSEDFEEINQVVLDGFSDNMSPLVQSVKCGSTNTTHSTTISYHMTKFFSEAYTLDEDTPCDGKIDTSGELFFKAQYLSCMQEISKWYW